MKPELQSGVEVAKLILVEQFAHILPSRDRDWVLKHQPEALADAVRLMENYLAVETALIAVPKQWPEAKGAPLDSRESPTKGTEQTGWLLKTSL